MAMKMAKASQADLDAAIDITHALDAINDQWFPSMPAALQNDAQDADFDIDNAEHCRAVLELLMEKADCGRLFRVTVGMMVLLDPRNKIVDDTLDHLDWHPSHQEHESDSQRLRWLCEDHSDPAVRAKAREILGRMPVMSYSAACQDIDIAMAEIKESPATEQAGQREDGV